MVVWTNRTPVRSDVMTMVGLGGLAVWIRGEYKTTLRTPAPLRRCPACSRSFWYYHRRENRAQ